MKIENNNLNPLSPKKPEASRPVSGSSRGVDAPSSAGAKDKAELSERARLLSKARGALDEVPEVNEARVAEVQQQVRDGTYAVPFEELARRLLARLRLR